MKPLPHLLLISLLVQRQKVIQHLIPGRWADRIERPLRGLVEAVAKVQVVLAIGHRRDLIHLYVQSAQAGDVLGSLLLVVEAVGGGRWPSCRACMIWRWYLQ